MIMKSGNKMRGVGVGLSRGERTGWKERGVRVLLCLCDITAGHLHFGIVVALHAERHHAVLHHVRGLREPFIPALSSDRERRERV